MLSILGAKKPCTEIKTDDFIALEKVLEKVGTNYRRMCDYLNISKGTCISLENDRRLSPYTIAENYISEHPVACWENIVRCLCQKFREKRLANEVAERYGIPYSEYCG